MKTFNYAPASPIKDNITMLAVSVGMVVVPLVYPFGIRIGSTRILGPTSTAIVFIIGGLVLLVPELIKDILNERNQTTVDSKRRNLP